MPVWCYGDNNTLATLNFGLREKLKETALYCRPTQLTCYITPEKEDLVEKLRKNIRCILFSKTLILQIADYNYSGVII